MCIRDSSNAKILEIIPQNEAEKLPIIYNYTIVDKDKCELSQSRNKIRFRSSAWVRRWIIKNMRFEIAEIPYPRKPKNIFRIISRSMKWITKYYVITKKKTYAGGYEPESLYSRKILINRNVVLVIS